MYNHYSRSGANMGLLLFIVYGALLILELIWKRRER
jgi:hypothetical protein